MRIQLKTRALQVLILVTDLLECINLFLKAAPPAAFAKQLEHDTVASTAYYCCLLNTLYCIYTTLKF